MKRCLPLLFLLLLLPVTASAGMVTEAKYDAGKLVLTAYADDDTVTVKSGKDSDIILVLDTSSTMNTNGAAYLAEVKTAVESFVSGVATLETKEMNRIAVLSYASAVKENVALMDASEAQSKLNRSILRVLDGSPNIATALTEAQTQLANSDPAERNQIVILLYDSSAITDAARTAAIAAAKVLKADGVELFCVDYATGTPTEAQAAFAAALSTGHFNKTTDLSVSGDFTAVLAKIVRQMGGAVYRPDVTTALRGTLSEAFGAPQADQIRVRAEECIRFSGETPAEWEERTLLTGYDIAVSGQTVIVTGFDYIANAVYKDDIGLHGSRLVAEIPLTWSETSGEKSIIVKDTKVPSGVYFKDDLLEAFKRPSVTFTGGTYTVVHQRADGTTAETTTHHILEDRTDDLTIKVSSNYLYGGLGSDTALPDGESAVSFHPTPNATYTIREVPATYLQPYVYSVWRNDGGQKTVTGLCLLTTVDGTDYHAVGFATGRGAQRDASLCDTVTVKAGGEVVDRLFVAADGRLSDGGEEAGTGRIGLYRLEKEFAAFQSAPLCFRPWWITQDGVRVTGSTVWICTHRGPGTGETYGSVAIEARTLGSRTTAVEE